MPPVLCAEAPVDKYAGSALILSYCSPMRRMVRCARVQPRPAPTVRGGRPRVEVERHQLSFGGLRGRRTGAERGKEYG